MSRNAHLKAIALLFLKLGITGFGGPAVHIAMMHREVVSKRKWLTEQDFLDLIGATNLIPGPNSTELAIHIGKEKGGWRGLVLAGVCFILPAVLITFVFAYAYKEYGQLPELRQYVYGIQPAIIAVVAGALVPLARKSIKSRALLWLALFVGVGVFLQLNELVLLFGSGFAALIVAYIKKAQIAPTFLLFPFLLTDKIAKCEVNLSNWKLFFVFLKIGSILYGSGYVLFAFLDAELVATGMLSKQTLVDAIAVGQFTPGPVFSAVTFIGYQIKGITAAIVSTVAIFIPAFLFVAFLNPLVKWLRESPHFSVFIDAVNVAAIVLILSVCIDLTSTAITNWKTVLIAVISFIICLRYKNVNSVFVLLGGAVLGYLLD
ncbi:chromate efflux transporter [Flavobacterium sp.]|uniref:chromate efflux transporter n=1 Tax=Flavobacterium sp. TaxID=239 RepID=UPI002602E37E|nr:chromate efflux transporter [Flavobacterium sp.]